ASTLLHSLHTSVLPPLSLHDALPICVVFRHEIGGHTVFRCPRARHRRHDDTAGQHKPGKVVGSEKIGHLRVPSNGQSVVLPPSRSEEHTSELQSRENLVCRLLLEKKK